MEPSQRMEIGGSMFNIYWHLRLIGCVVMIVGTLLNNLLLTLIGFFVNYVGAVGAVDRLEHQVKELLKEKEDALSVTSEKE